MQALQGSRSISQDIDNDVRISKDRLVLNQSTAIPGGMAGNQRYAGQSQQPQSFIKRGLQMPTQINLSNNTIDDIALKKETGLDSTLGNTITKQVKVHMIENLAS